MAPSDEDEAEGVTVPFVEVVVALAAGVRSGEVALLAPGEGVPLVVGAVVEDGAGERCELESVLLVTDGLLLDLRVEPTSFLKRLDI